jgi:hypothetical protein
MKSQLCLILSAYGIRELSRYFLEESTPCSSGLCGKYSTLLGRFIYFKRMMVTLASADNSLPCVIIIKVLFNQEPSTVVRPDSSCCLRQLFINTCCCIRLRMLHEIGVRKGYIGFAIDENISDGP